MLRTLSIRNIVLIERLDLSFGPGLGVLTGETGSGKSILLDALGLAVGARADAGLVRSGTDQASVTAEFDHSENDAVVSLLREQGLREEDTLVLRRLIGADGRSRAFINDQLVSVGLLRQVGDCLVEVHGQMETHGLLDPGNHRRILDAFGGYGSDIVKTSTAYKNWQAAVDARTQAELDLQRAKEDEEYLRHVVAELVEVDPQPDEEASLAARRSILMHGEQIIEAANTAFDSLNEGRGVEGAMRAAAAAVEKVADKADGQFDDVIAAFNRALSETTEAVAALESASAAVDLDPAELEKAEERLFALRALARKHNCDVGELPAVKQRLETQLATVEEGSDALDRLRAEEAAAQGSYASAAGRLSQQRVKTVKRLDRAVAGELKPLMLGGAVFETVLEALPSESWGQGGKERAQFCIQTNPNTPAGPLHRVASGGELARLMLALKVVIADADSVPTLIFDEVDAGIGGAAAAAVGDRLGRLADNLQVLVVTHSPQVAARGGNHWRITKSSAKAGNLTEVNVLSDDDRTDEIARMLAGAKVTDEARAAAVSLLTDGAEAAE